MDFSYLGIHRCGCANHGFIGEEKTPVSLISILLGFLGYSIECFNYKCLFIVKARSFICLL